MKIRAALGFNLIDYPGKIAAVAFVPGCDYLCPACHAKPILDEAALISGDEFLEYLAGARRWVNGVVVCGGEPTLQPGLIPFLTRLKAADLAVKLDTNGGSPEVLSRLLAEKLVDYTAMDVKGPRSLWAKVSGRPGAEAAMFDGMRIAARFPDYEFRTTAAPVVRGGEEISFFTASEMAETAKMIAEVTGGVQHKYYIQKFVPRKDGLLDPRLESFPETPPRLLEEMKKEVTGYLPKCEIRG
ncbi:MAG: anaerobic ribonucleoside-triphosphate reductase activating protein [Elusimicrobia bacterium GWA2_56_46]|nr:MAG: anaerobic ribonucleoside-triphosphate reductase activating protein [Elusimicrobia bacterium GWA2_56_46]OGR56147.1 MAG: anaerobic ribonucleoside-triphosphate reductase activating protein [Elusimicrobia bacterium GWC2_56_31]HBB66348.1 anaerobic ribonucleoside-triphosphate reductase activating protein [Elusimicrobiota bacterium]HBW23080.1 anaerobic ribonucleoside-triphosphate reductase activating protein [Elusimicrobiota bacterium]